MDIILNWLQSGFSSIAPIFILLGLLVFVHEAGHFLVAKYFKVRVEVFSLGFGKKLFQYKKGDTNYCISLIPLGGYVKMFGDDPSVEIPDDQKPYSFLHKPVGPRIAIVLAGPLMNFFFAILIFTCIAFIGELMPAPVVGDVAIDTKAFQSGFRSGDEILKIKGQAIHNWDEVKKLIYKHSKTPLKFLVRGEGKEATRTLEAIPEPGINQDILSSDDLVGQIPGLKMASISSIVGIEDPNSLAGKAGIQNLDVITAINDRPVRYFRHIEPLLIEFGGQGKLVFTLQKFDDEKAIKRTVELTQLGPDFVNNPLSKLGLSRADTFLAGIKKESPAEKAGLKVGDKLLAINQLPITEWENVVSSVKAFAPESSPLQFDVLRNGKTLSMNITPEMTELQNQKGQDENRYTIGIIPALLTTRAPPVTLQFTNPLAAVARGTERSIHWSYLVGLSFVRLFQGRVSTKSIGGVITIGRVASETFKIGVTAFLKIMGIISINLFLINLFPIPILDGGHLVFFGFEAIRGAPLSLKKVEIAQQIGLVLLLGLMIFTLFNDVNNWIQSSW